MSAATMERPRAAVHTRTNPGDHRAAAVAVVKSITERATEIWGGADGMADHAWCLLDTAASLGEKLVERNEPVVIDHSGGLACCIRDFEAALHGVRALIMEVAEKDWTPDDVATMDMIRTAGPQLRDLLADLERQRHWEVDLGNKTRAEPSAEVAQVDAEETSPWSLSAYALAAAEALEKAKPEPIYRTLVASITGAMRAIEAISDDAPDAAQCAAAVDSLEHAAALAAFMQLHTTECMLEGATATLLQLALKEMRATAASAQEASHA